MDWLANAYPNRLRKVTNLMKASRGGRLYTPEFGTRMRGTGIFANLLERRFDRAVRQHDFNRHAWRPTLDAFRPPLRSGDQLRLL